MHTNRYVFFQNLYIYVFLGPLLFWSSFFSNFDLVHIFGLYQYNERSTYDNIGLKGMSLVNVYFYQTKIYAHI